ncbi:MAG: phosphate transporter, inner rane subunit PstA [Clostridiales bacterium]|jgi:phosphate transport system permease protein|nr:phosphate transporter, inner rane subunit PstA [Clostridiales bacterium]
MKSNIKSRKIKDAIFHGIIFLVTCIGVIVLFLLLLDLFQKGLSYLKPSFLTSFPSSKLPKASGILPGLIGSLYIIVLTVMFSVPIGLSTAIYLEEYAPKNKLTEFIKVNVSNLSGTPSIVYGLLGLTLFNRLFGFGRSIMSGALTLTLVVLPIVIVTSQESIRAVPQFLRHGSYAMGATKWQTIRKIVVPSAFSGILTGIILTVSRALGETAPLLMAGAYAFVRYLPEGIMGTYTVLPLQIYNWISMPNEEFQKVAAAGILVLLAFLLSANAIAIFLRNKYQRQID